MSRYAFLLVLLLSLTSPAVAEVHLPKALSDHAVLQRGRPIHIWGTATPGAKITARFHTQTVHSQADRLGQWSLYFDPESAGGPYSLRVEGDGPEVRLSDLLVGDVWLASGQSNMEMPLSGFPPTAVVKDAEKEIAGARNPRIRFLLVEHKASDFPINEVSNGWTECTPDTAARFSAVAYFFGRQISQEENVPIGLIDSTWGGTPADSWVSLGTLASSSSLMPALASRAAFADEQTNLEATIAAEQREDAGAKAAGKPAPGHPWHPFEMSWMPAALYNGMIAPLTEMTVKGFLWYQGETNSAPDRAPYYDTLMHALIGDWRAHFAQGNLPFLYVQISSFESPGENWGMLRDQQRRTLSVANTAMAVSLDVGLPRNVHPPDKQTVAKRLALAAEGMVYGKPVRYQGPLFREASTVDREDGTTDLRVWFDHAEGLKAQQAPVTGFEVAGRDHRFVTAEAHIDGSSVVLHAAGIPDPAFARYGWASVVQDSLYNSDGLPASTFTSEEIPSHSPGSY